MQIKDALGVKQQLLEDKNRTGQVGKSEHSAATASGASAKQAAADKVELSAASRELARATDAASGAADVRAEKVAEIRRRLENQEYQVDAEQVAHKMIVSFLGDIV